MSVLKELKARRDGLRAAITDADKELKLASAALLVATTDSAREKVHARIEAATRAEERASRELGGVLDKIADEEARLAADADDNRWNEHAIKGAILVAKTQKLQAACDQFLAQFQRTVAAGEACRDSRPVPMPPNQSFDMYWHPNTLTHITKVEFFIRSDGKLAFGGPPGASVWTLKQGPDMLARVRENVTRSLSQRPPKDRAA